jgi:hypothetical protein
MDLRKYHKQYAVGVESTVMDYTLNINRALKKKLKATLCNYYYGIIGFSKCQGYVYTFVFCSQIAGTQPNIKMYAS